MGIRCISHRLHLVIHHGLHHGGVLTGAVWAERLLLAHRYLYYVVGKPVLKDSDYDALERGAMSIIPDDSPIRRPGSSNPYDYPEVVMKMAEALLHDPPRIYDYLEE